MTVRDRDQKQDQDDGKEAAGGDAGEASEEASGGRGEDIDEELRLLGCLRDGEPGARAVYADWLEERGQLDRATLLRREGPLADSLAELLRWAYLLELGVQRFFEVVADAAVLAMGTGVDILPGTEAQIAVRPQRCPFRPTRLIVPDSLAPHFAICDIKVGNRSQLETSDPIPASLFTAASVQQHGGRISFEVVNTAADFSLVVRCTDDERSHPFFALVFGIEVPVSHGPHGLRPAPHGYFAVCEDVERVVEAQRREIEYLQRELADARLTSRRPAGA